VEDKVESLERESENDTNIKSKLKATQKELESKIKETT